MRWALVALLAATAVSGHLGGAISNEGHTRVRSGDVDDVDPDTDTRVGVGLPRAPIISDGGEGPAVQPAPVIPIQPEVVPSIPITPALTPSRIIVEDLTERNAGGSWGNAIYPERLPSWSSFARAVGDLSKECDVQQPTLACGIELVCRNGICAPCYSDSECADKHHCQSEIDGRNVCVPRSLFSQFSSIDYVLTICVFICTVLSAASGVGGGGMFVPLFLLFLDLTPSDAVPLSQCLIVFSSFINLSFFVFQRHPTQPNKPKIDYETVMLLEPGLAAGVVVGVMLNRISPRWLITGLLVITLGVSFMRTAQKSVKLWQAETAKVKGDGASNSARSEVAEEKMFDTEGLALAGKFGVPIMIIVIVWLVTFLSNFHNVKNCSWQYVLYLSAFFFVMAAITYGGGRYLMSGGSGSGATPRNADDGTSIKWTATTTITYPLVACFAGLLGGMLGLGGGIIMAPFLVELGLHPEVVQASTALFVFVSSSLASLQFAVNDQIMPEYVMYYGTVAVFATILGQTLVNRLVRSSGRSSIIVMCIAGVLIVSLVMMTYLGITGTYADYERGAYMGLDFYKLCLA